MNRLILSSALTVVLAGMVLWLSSCQASGRTSGHTMAKAKIGYEIKCRLCYDEAVKIRRAHAKGTPWRRYQTIKKHLCPNCKVEIVLYTQEGDPMIRCEKCVPEGIACDLCVPPKSIN